MMWKELSGSITRLHYLLKCPLEEDALASSFRCTLGEKTPFIQSGPKMSRIFVADAHRDDGKRFVVRAEEKVTAFSATGSGDPRDRPRSLLLTKLLLAAQFVPQRTHCQQR